MCREYERNRRASMSTVQCEALIEEPRQQQQNTNNLSPSQSINLEVDDSEVTQRMQQFHTTLTALANVLCDVCLERYPCIKADVTGVCNRCRVDSEVPKLYSVTNNMDPSAVPPELRVSLYFLTTITFRKALFPYQHVID